MKILNLKMSIGMLIGGLITGFFLSLFFQGCAGSATTDSTAIVAPETIKNELTEKVAAYEQKIADLETKNSNLQKQLNTAKVQLAAAKVKVHQRETNIKKRIEPAGFPAKELLNKVRPSPTVDSSLSACDSLVKDVAAYIEENAAKDSLYEVQINTLDSMVDVKDSVIAEKTKINKNVTEAFTKSLEQQEVLLKENQQLRNKSKRQKRRSKLATIGLMILSALGGKQLSQH
jgi:hypothetical protein